MGSALSRGPHCGSDCDWAGDSRKVAAIAKLNAQKELSTEEAAAETAEKAMRKQEKRERAIERRKLEIAEANRQRSLEAEQKRVAKKKGDAARLESVRTKALQKLDKVEERMAEVETAKDAEKVQPKPSYSCTLCAE